MNNRQLRVVRGTIAGGLSVFFALVSHVLGGGVMPGWLGILAPFVLSVFVCAALAGRRLSLGRLSISVVVSQALFHTLFVMGLGGVPAGGYGHHVRVNLPALSSLAATPVHGAMWVAHAAAAMLTIAALYRGERVLRGLVVIARRSIGRFVARATSTMVSTPARVSPPTTVSVSTHASSGAVNPRVLRRGPPLVAA